MDTIASYLINTKAIVCSEYKNMYNFKYYTVLGLLHLIFVDPTLCIVFECSEGQNSYPTCSLDEYEYQEAVEFVSNNYYKGYVKDLWISNSNIAYLPQGMFVQLPAVHSFHVSECNLKELSRYDFKSATALVTLDLSRNQLTELVNSAFYGADNLEICDLSFNQITNIHSNAFKNLIKLTTINLTHNHITTVPNNVFAYVMKLDVSIDLSNNFIESIDMPFGSALIFIKKFNLNTNRLSNISFASDLVNIENLLLNNNEIVRLQTNGFVKVLHADSNRLVNDNFYIGGDSLVDLSLANNSLVNFNFLKNISKSLKLLDLSFNPIVRDHITSSTFSNFSHLKSLYLESINLERIDFQLFADLLQLETLDISYNNLNSINFHMLSLLENLTRLYINGNNLTSLTLNEFDFLFPNLKQIDISDNSWLCDHLVDILRHLRQINVNIIIDREKLVKNDTNIRGMRCYHNTSEFLHINDNVTTKVASFQKHLDDREHDNSNGIEDLQRQLNQTKLQWTELQGENKILKIELNKIVTNISQNTNNSTVIELSTNLSRMAQNILNLTGEINLLKFKLNSIPAMGYNNSEKVMMQQNAISTDVTADNNHISGDIKLMKFILLVFLLVGCCLLGLMVYRFYFKRNIYRTSQVAYPSTNTLATTIEENNF